MKNCIIGLTGFDGAGKTTVANYLEREHGFTVVSFADELKRLLMVLDPIVGVDEDEDSRGVTIAYPVRLSDFVDDSGEFHEYDLKTQYPEYRRLLQVFGTDVVRNGMGEDTWVDILYQRLLGMADEAMFKGEPTRVVVPDVRFHNEADIVRGLAAMTGAACSVAFIESATPEEPSSEVHESNLYAGNLGEDREIERDLSGNELSPFEVVQVEAILLDLGVTDA